MTAVLPDRTGPANRDCATNGCNEPAHTRGHCHRHYRYRLHTGRYGYRDATRVREHVLTLRELGWTYVQISEASTVSPWVAHKLVSGVTRRVLVDTETALLAVPLVSARCVDKASPLCILPVAGVRYECPHCQRVWVRDNGLWWFRGVWAKKKRQP